MEKLNKGQSLVEVLIAVGIGAIVMLTALVLLQFIIRLQANDPVAQASNFLAQELVNAISVAAESSWGSVAGVTPGAQYYIASSASGFVVTSGAESKIINNVSYTRYFTVTAVLRDTITDAISMSGSNDPSTKKITTIVTWAYQGQPYSIIIEKYVSRTRNEALWQTDWVGGSTCPGADPAVTNTNNRFCANVEGVLDYTSEPGSIKLYGY